MHGLKWPINSTRIVRVKLRVPHTGFTYRREAEARSGIDREQLRHEFCRLRGKPVREKRLVVNGACKAHGRGCRLNGTMRAELIGHFQPCMTDIYLHIDARMADYIRTHP